MRITALPIGRLWLFILVLKYSDIACASRWQRELAIDLPQTDLRSIDLRSTTSRSTTRTASNRIDDDIFPASSMFPGLEPHSQRRKKSRVGSLSLDLPGTTFALHRATEETRQLSEAEQEGESGEDNSQTKPTEEAEAIHEQTEVAVTLDPASTVRLVRSLAGFSVYFGASFMGTLRLLAPLIVSRRALNAAGDLVVDYLRGRYLRKTYSRMENMYIRYYELPAALRAASRTAAQISIFFLMGKIFFWMVGVGHAPCRLNDGRCRSWCAFLWMLAVVGTGHACSSAVAVWGGPLRVQVAASHLHTGKSLAARIFTRPWHILQWMQDPEQWISMISTQQNFVPQPFDPNPILYPATWVPLRFLQMIAVAKAASSTPPNWHSKRDPVRVIMRRFLIELAFADEWHRVFIAEKRPGLAVCVAFCYMVASISLMVVTVVMDPTAALLLVPSLLAMCVSGWMNVVIFWNRLADNRKRETINAFNERREAALRAIKEASFSPNMVR